MFVPDCICYLPPCSVPQPGDDLVSMWKEVGLSTTDSRDWSVRNLLSSTWFNVSEHFVGDARQIRAVMRLPWPIKSGSSSSVDTSSTITTDRSSSSSSSSVLQNKCVAAAAADSPVDLQGLNPEQLAAAASWAYPPGDSLPAFLKYKTAEFLVDRWQGTTSLDFDAEAATRPFDIKGNYLGVCLASMVCTTRHRGEW